MIPTSRFALDEQRRQLLHTPVRTPGARRHLVRVNARERAAFEEVPDDVCNWIARRSERSLFRYRTVDEPWRGRQVSGTPTAHDLSLALAR